MAQSDFSYERLALLLDGVKAMEAAVQIFSASPPVDEVGGEHWALLLAHMGRSLERSRLEFCLSHTTANCQPALKEVVNG